MKKIRYRIEAVGIIILLVFLAAFILGPNDRKQPKPDRRQFGGIQVFVADVAGEQPAVRIVQGRLIDTQDSTVTAKRTGKKHVVGTCYWIVPGQPAEKKPGRRAKP